MLRISKLALVLALSLLSVRQSHAADVPPVRFTDLNGQQMSVEKATSTSLAGQAVMRCQPVKAEVNKSGTGISFKVVKKSN